jgi:hypothetical protein
MFNKEFNNDEYSVTLSQKVCITHVSNLGLWKRQSVVQDMYHHHHHHYPLLTTPVNVWQKFLPPADRVKL